MIDVVDRRLHWIAENELSLEKGQPPLQTSQLENGKTQVMSYFKGKGSSEADEAHKAFLVARLRLENGYEYVQSGTFLNCHRKFKGSNEVQHSLSADEKTEVKCCDKLKITIEGQISESQKIHLSRLIAACDTRHKQSEGRKRKPSSPRRSPDSGMHGLSSVSTTSSPDTLQTAMQEARILPNNVQGNAKAMRVENYSPPEIYDDETHFDNILNVNNVLSDVSTSLTGDSAYGSFDPGCNKDSQHQADPTCSLAPSHSVDDILIAPNDDFNSELLDELLIELNGTYPESQALQELGAEAQGASNNWQSDGPVKSRLRSPAESPLDKDIKDIERSLQEPEEDILETGTVNSIFATAHDTESDGESGETSPAAVTINRISVSSEGSRRRRSHKKAPVSTPRFYTIPDAHPDSILGVFDERSRQNWNRRIQVAAFLIGVSYMLYWIIF